LHRVHGTGPHHDLVELEWQAAAAPTAVPKATTHVGWRVVGTGDAFVWRPVATTGTSASTSTPHSTTTGKYVLSGLQAPNGKARAFEVVVQETSHQGKKASSAPVIVRTSTVGAVHTLVYRIAEFQFEPDFLDNHDGASKLSMPVYGARPWQPTIPPLVTS
jgi:hypothetical protein